MKATPTLSTRGRKMKSAQYIGQFPDGNPQENLTRFGQDLQCPSDDQWRSHCDWKVFGLRRRCRRRSGDANSSRKGIRFAQKSAIAAGECSASPTSCGPGQYRVSYYLDSSVGVPFAGNAAATLVISWKDESSARSLQVPLSGTVYEWKQPVSRTSGQLRFGQYFRYGRRAAPSPTPQRMSHARTVKAVTDFGLRWRSFSSWRS